MLLIDTTTIAVIIILGVAAFVRSAIGFGDGLIAMGLVTGWIGLQTATPLVALIGTAISSSILATQWRQVDLKAALPLIVSTLIGIPIGLGRTSSGISSQEGTRINYPPIGSVTV